MIDFIENNWVWLTVAIIVLSFVLLVMGASKRKDSDIADSLDDNNEPLEYNEWGLPKSNNRA